MAKEEKAAPAPEMKMQPDEFAELRAQVAAVKEQDVHLGRVLEALLLHVGHAHGLDPAVEDAKAKAAAEEAAKAEEEARVKAEAEAKAEAQKAAKAEEANA